MATVAGADASVAGTSCLSGCIASPCGSTCASGGAAASSSAGWAAEVTAASKVSWGGSGEPGRGTSGVIWQVDGSPQSWCAGVSAGVGEEGGNSSSSGETVGLDRGVKDFLCDLYKGKGGMNGHTWGWSEALRSTTQQNSLGHVFKVLLPLGI